MQPASLGAPLVGRSKARSKLPLVFRLAIPQIRLRPTVTAHVIGLLAAELLKPASIAANAELHGVAERLFRAVGNQQGRHRLSGAGRLQATATPRALVLATGDNSRREAVCALVCWWSPWNQGKSNVQCSASVKQPDSKACWPAPWERLCSGWPGSTKRCKHICRGACWRRAAV